MLKFRVDRRIKCQEAVVSYNWITDKIVFDAILSTCAVYTNSSRSPTSFPGSLSSASHVPTTREAEEETLGTRLLGVSESGEY